MNKDLKYSEIFTIEISLDNKEFYGRINTLDQVANDILTRYIKEEKKEKGNWVIVGVAGSYSDAREVMNKIKEEIEKQKKEYKNKEQQ
jgi:hypothetical protein